jgi:transposase
MRGSDSYNERLFSTVRLEDFVPANHPLRPIRTWTNEALASMDERFSAMYEADVRGGRPSIAPEKLMRAMLLQVLFSVRSERQLVEQINYNLLFRWFVAWRSRTACGTTPSSARTATASSSTMS